ncbi:MAG: hypothetical protein U9R43_05755 [Thermodesulfobacteriota bacterium]|nr:hypothetical protein [Thermodesulfobacteriota bacterium]
MPKISEKRLKNVFRLLEDSKVFTLDKLVSFLSCSTPTARLKLKQWKAYTSYNKNSRYYAMPTVARFDENGIWYWENIFFSKYGNLKKTVIHLINNSSSGLSGKEIGDLVRLPVRSFLHHFRNLSGIQREKREGVYIYFSEDSDRYKQQLQSRLTRLEPPDKLFTDADAVVILTALIKHHDIGMEDIMALPEVRARKFSPDVIGDFMDRHGLFKKKPITKH